MVDVEELIEKAGWIKTDYIQPHEYVLYNNEPVLVRQMNYLIEDEGYTKEFMGVKYRYVDVGEYRYWLIGVVLNRARNE